MADVRIKVNKNGPYLVEGPVTLVDFEGRAFQVQEKFWLCRCGGSSNKPFCDGTHSKNGFRAETTAPQA